ncbi:MAG: hypothetical protein LBH47_01780 [Christensenellaceae bacterium]|nr:hypothetical protein [Christensenellaceae bacterium]
MKEKEERKRKKRKKRIIKEEQRKTLVEQGIFNKKEGEPLRPGDYVRCTPDACEKFRKNQQLKRVVRATKIPTGDIITMVDNNGEKDFISRKLVERVSPTEEEKAEFNKKLGDKITKVFARPKHGDYVQCTAYACETLRKDRQLRKVLRVELIGFGCAEIIMVDENGQEGVMSENLLEIVFPTEEEKAEFNKKLQKKRVLTGPKVGDFVRYTLDACEMIVRKRTLRMVVSVGSSLITIVDANGGKDFISRKLIERVFPTEEEKAEFNKKLEQGKAAKNPKPPKGQDDKSNN